MPAEHAVSFGASKEMGPYVVFPMHVSHKIGLSINCLSQQPVYAYSISERSAAHALMLSASECQNGNGHICSGSSVHQSQSLPLPSGDIK